jgi:hypothetical protein
VNIEELEEIFKPESGSMCFSACETYRSNLFNFRTGEFISVLQVGDFSFEGSTIMLKGKLEVNSDEECWDIFLKFRKDKLSGIINNYIREIGAKRFRQGQNDIKIKFKNLMLFKEY